MIGTREAAAYVSGWSACFAGADGRYANPHASNRASEKFAWDHGFLDAMEAEPNEKPEAECAGY